MRTLDFMLEALSGNHKFVLATLKGVPADKVTTQVPGVPNHFVWTIGHLAMSYHFFASTLGVSLSPCPESWNKLFGMGAQPTGDASVYPTLAEVIAAYDKAHSEYHAALSKLTDEQLAEKPVNDGGGFVSSKGNAVMACVFHLGWHLGQLTLLRKGLGLGSMFS